MPSSKKNSDIQYKAAPQGMVNLDEAEGIVECFVAGIGNKDSVGDVCAPGAFGKSLIRRKPRVVWGHNWNDPIGKVLDMYEVAPSDPRLPNKMKAAGIGGLYARVQFNLKSEKGREAFANVAFFGEEQEWSIGYKTINAKFDPQMQANILYEVELYEVSPVLHGANQLTGTISIKSEDQSSAVLVNEQQPIDGLNVNELSSVLDALKTIASTADEKCGPGMPMGMPSQMPMGMPTSGPGMPSAPKPMQVQAPREAVKPEVPSMPENPMLVAIRRELVDRTGSNIIVRSVIENIVVFDRITTDGISSTYKLPFNYANNEFMFGKPEKINTQPTPESSIPTMPGMPQQFGGFDTGKSLISFDDFSWAGFNQQIPAQQVDVSTLNNIISNLEKIIEEKSTYIIPVDVNNAFEVKQAIDPILDYYRVDATVTEDGIIVKSLDNEFINAMDIATKGVLRSIGNMVGRAVDRPNIGKNRRDRNLNLASRGRGIGSRGAVVRLADGTMWDPKTAPDRNSNGIVGEGLTDGRGMSLSQPDPTPDGPASIRAPKTPKTPKATAPKASNAPKKATRLSSGATDYDASFKRNGWKKKGDKWSKGNWEIEATGPNGLSAYNPKNPETLEQERDPSVSALRHLNQFERILRGSDDTNFDDDTTRLSSGGDDSSRARDLAKQREMDKARGASATNPVGKEAVEQAKKLDKERAAARLRQEAIDSFEDMTPAEYQGWVEDYTDGGNSIGPGDTSAEVREMFIDDYIYANENTKLNKREMDFRKTPKSETRLSSGRVIMSDGQMEISFDEEDGDGIYDATRDGFRIIRNERGGGGGRRFPESTATYGGSGLSEAKKKEILDVVKDSSNPLVQKILRGSAPARSNLSDKQWAVLKREFEKNKKKTPSGYVSNVRSGGTVAPGAKLDGGIAYLEPDHANDKDYENLRDAIQTAMRSNEMLRFDYSGKNREVIPVKIEKNNKTGKWNLTAQDDTGARKLFSLDKITPSSTERLSSGAGSPKEFEWTKTDDGFEVDAPDIDGGYQIQGNSKDGFVVTRFADARRNGGQDAQEYEHDKVFTSSSAAKKWAERNYKLIGEEIGKEDVEIRKADAERSADFNNMTPEEAADYAAYMDEESWRDRDGRFSSGQRTRIDAAEKEVGDDPEKMADFLVEQGILEEDHPRVKKLRKRYNNFNYDIAQDEVEKAYETLAEMDAEDQAEHAAQFKNAASEVSKLTKPTMPDLDGMDEDEVEDALQELNDEILNFADETEGIIRESLGGAEYNKRFGGAVPLIEELSKNHDGGNYEREIALENALERANSFNRSVAGEMELESNRFSSGIDFDKKGASGLREMRHVERNSLRMNSSAEKAERDAYEKDVAAFIKNNGFFVEVPMYNGDPKWQSEDFYRAREFATNVAKLRFEDNYQNETNQFMRFFDKPGKPSKKDFFAKKGTVDYKTWYMAHTPLLTSEIDSVLNSDLYSDNYKESYMNAIRSFLYVNRPEFGPYGGDDPAYQAWLQQSGLGWGGRYSTSGPKFDEMGRFSSGATRGSRKDNYINTYENPEDLKEAIFSELIGSQYSDREGMTAEDIAYALNVRAESIEPLLDGVKKDVADAYEDYGRYLESQPDMTDEELQAMADDYARAQTVTDKFADMTPEEAADYAAYMEEESWRDRDGRFSSGATGDTSEDRITKFYKDMAERNAVLSEMTSGELADYAEQWNENHAEDSRLSSGGVNYYDWMRKQGVPRSTVDGESFSGRDGYGHSFHDYYAEDAFANIDEAVVEALLSDRTKRTSIQDLAAEAKEYGNDLSFGREMQENYGEEAPNPKPKSLRAEDLVRRPDDMGSNARRVAEAVANNSNGKGRKPSREDILHFTYDGKQRSVYPESFGTSKKGVAFFRAWDETADDGNGAYRNFNIDKIEGLVSHAIPPYVEIETRTPKAKWSIADFSIEDWAKINSQFRLGELIGPKHDVEWAIRYETDRGGPRAKGSVIDTAERELKRELQIAFDKHIDKMVEKGATSSKYPWDIERAEKYGVKPLNKESRLSSGGSGKFDISSARSFDDMSDREQLAVFNGIKERLSENNPSMVSVLEDGGLDIDGYLADFPQLHPDFSSGATDYKNDKDYVELDDDDKEIVDAIQEAIESGELTGTLGWSDWADGEFENYGKPEQYEMVYGEVTEEDLDYARGQDWGFEDSGPRGSERDYRPSEEEIYDSVYEGGLKNVEAKYKLRAVAGELMPEGSTYGDEAHISALRQSFSSGATDYKNDKDYVELDDDDKEIVDAIQEAMESGDITGESAWQDWASNEFENWGTQEKYELVYGGVTEEELDYARYGRDWGFEDSGSRGSERDYSPSEEEIYNSIYEEGLESVEVKYKLRAVAAELMPEGSKYGDEEHIAALRQSFSSGATFDIDNARLFDEMSDEEQSNVIEAVSERLSETNRRALEDFIDGGLSVDEYLANFPQLHPDFPSPEGERFSSGGKFGSAPPKPKRAARKGEEGLIDGARKRRGDFWESIVGQHDKNGGQLTEGQWSKLAEILGTGSTPTTAGAPARQGPKSKTGTKLPKYSGKRRKIIGLDEVEPYDYPEAAFKPNPEQGDAIDAMMTGSDVKVGALAATGKTTTVISFANRLRAQDPTARIAYLVFNKAAQLDAVKRGMGDNVSVMTMDALTYRAMIGNSGMPGLRPGLKNKMYEAGKESMDESVRSYKGKAAYLGIRGAFIPREDDAPLELTPTDIYKIVAKGIDAYSISADDAIGPQHFTGAFNGALAIPEDSPIMSDVLKYANKMWEDLQQDRDNLKKQGMLDFSSNHLTKMWALTKPDVGSFAGDDGVNVIMVDEAQDINPVFAKMMREARSAQKIYIGDTNQAINAWRGADGSTLDAVEAEYDMPITESYRFGAKIAGIGNRFLSLLGVKERMTGKKTKAGSKGSRIDVPGEVRDMDSMDATMILCRSNGGAIAATMEVITQSNGQKKVYGSANFKSDLQNFIDNIEWMQNTAAGDPHWTNSYGRRQTDRPQFSADLEGITTIEEFDKEVAKADNNRLNMLDGLLKKHTIEELREALDGILTSEKDIENLEPEDYVKIQTAHTSKGLESRKVKIWSDFRKPKFDPETEEWIYPNQQELRLSYVAVTRAEEEIDLGSLGWVLDHTTSADELPNPTSARLSSGKSKARGNRGDGKGRGTAWSAEDRRRFADGDVLRAQTRPGKRRQGPSAGEFSSGARFAPDGESGSRIQRRLSSGEYFGPPPTGSDRYDRKRQVGATLATFHTDPGTAVISPDMSGVLGTVPKGRESHVLNSAVAEKIIANPDMEYSADNGWPVDAGKLLDFIEVNEEDAIKTLREIGDAQRIATILGIPESSAQDMLDGKPVYIGSGTAADMFDSLRANGEYPDSVGGFNDVARVWGFDGAPKWVRVSDIATPEYDLNENGNVNWSAEKWDGLSRAQFDAEVRNGKNPPEPVYISPVEFFNGDAIASNPKWDARAGSFRNPTADSDFAVAPRKLTRAEQLEPPRAASQARVGERTAMADKDFAAKWIKRGHGVTATNMMDILGVERDSKKSDLSTEEMNRLIEAMNEVGAKAGLSPLSPTRPATKSELKKSGISDEFMHALVTSGRFKNMKEAMAGLGDSGFDSLAAEYDSRMLTDAALIRIKDKMNKDGVPDANKIIAKAMTTALGRKTDVEARVKEGRVTIKGDMKEDGMISDAKISEILSSVNEALARSGYPEISQDELFPKDETGGYIGNLSSAVPGAPRMSSGQRFISRTSSSRRADATNDAVTRREGNASRLSSGASVPFKDENGKLVPNNIGQAAREATPTGPGFDNNPTIQRKTPHKNLEEFEKALKTRQAISELFAMNRKNTPGFSVYDYEEELIKAGFPSEEIEKMVDSFVQLDSYIDDVETYFEEAREKLDKTLEDIEDSLSKIERLKQAKVDAIKKWGNTEDNAFVLSIEDKIAAEMMKIDEAYQSGIGGKDGRLGTLHPRLEKMMTEMPGWSEGPYGMGNDINQRLLEVEASITKAGGTKKAVAVTGIDFGVPEGTRLSSGRADEYYQNLTSHLIAMIEKSQKEGGSWDAPWHRAGNIPRNASTKNMYSGGNLFALMLAAEEKGYTTPQWAGFQQWKKLGGTVKKGEKATIILIPRQIFGEEIDDNGVKVRKSKGVSFSTAHVFNFDQIEGIDREEFLKAPTDALTPEQRVGKLEDAIKEIGATIDTGDGSSAYYSPREDRVVMPPFELFKSPEGYYGTLAHELVHWTGHSSRLDRKNMNQFGSPEYAREELIAEFGAAFLLAQFGLSSVPREDHAHYLANWLQVLRDEPNALQEASIKAQAASKLLIEKMKIVLEEMGVAVSDAESATDVKSLQIFNDPLYGVKDGYIEWSKDPFNAPFLVKSLNDKNHSSGLVNRSWERIAETAIFLELLSRKK